MVYNVMGKRFGKWFKFNKKPMNKNQAQLFAKQLKKATIPSVEIKSIKLVFKSKRKKK